MIASPKKSSSYNPANRAKPVPRALRAQAEQILAENYAYMDSPIFKQRGLEAELFSFEEKGGEEPALPLTSWYQPTREEIADQLSGNPQLMKAPEERLMFRRFNFPKRKHNILKKKPKREGRDKKLAEQLVEWHRRYEHFREYLVRTNLALVLAMAKRTRLGD